MADTRPESPDEILARVRREAHDAVHRAQKSAFEEETNLADLAEFDAYSAIDRLAEVAELKGRIMQIDCVLPAERAIINDLLAEIRRIGDAR